MKDNIKVFSVSFQDSFFDSQKISSICTEELVVPELWGPYTVSNASKNYLSVCKGLDFIRLLLTQES